MEPHEARARCSPQEERLRGSQLRCRDYAPLRPPPEHPKYTQKRAWGQGWPLSSLGAREGRENLNGHSVYNRHSRLSEPMNISRGHSAHPSPAHVPVNTCEKHSAVETKEAVKREDSFITWLYLTVVAFMRAKALASLCLIYLLLLTPLNQGTLLRISPNRRHLTSMRNLLVNTNTMWQVCRRFHSQCAAVRGCSQSPLAMSHPSYLPDPKNLPKGFPTPSSDGTIRPRFFAYPHLRAMWPIMLSGAFVMWKFFENFNAQELKKASEADFEQSCTPTHPRSSLAIPSLCLHFLYCDKRAHRALE